MANHTNNKPLHILVIEDNHADAEMIRIFLEETNMYFQMVHVDTLREGFATLRDTTPFNLVILDLGLPDSNGLNTLRKYMNDFHHIPVIVMTGSNDQRKGMEAVKAGAQDYLVKGDFTAQQMAKSIHYSMERFRQRAIAEDKAQQAMTQLERLEELQEMASLGTWEMDMVSNAMTWSKELFTLFQIQQGTLAPSLSDYIQLVHREDRAAVENFIAEAIRLEEHGPIEHRILIDGRNLKKLSLRTRIRFDESSNRILLTGTVYDITPHDKEKKPLANQAASLPEISQEGKEEILNQISFNIRTPLSTVVHLLYLLEQTQLAPKQGQLVQDLKTTIDELSFTLSNLVNMSILTNEHLPDAKDQFRPRHIGVYPAGDEIQGRTAQPRSGYSRRFRLAVTVRGDSNRLSQLFFCMMELAFMHSEDTFIKLRCTIEDETPNTPQLAVQLEYSGVLPKWPEQKYRQIPMKSLLCCVLSIQKGEIIF
ncbi:MAG: response regulator [Saprospiraceae bacterium]